MRPFLSTVFLIAFSVIFYASDSNKPVGRQACLRCHTPEQRTLPGTTHDNDKACEACHGPGEQHLKSTGGAGGMFSFPKASASEIREKCSQCHNNPVMLKHATGDVSCLNCHSIHHYVRRKYLLKAEDSFNTARKVQLPRYLLQAEITQQ